MLQQMGIDLWQPRSVSTEVDREYEVTNEAPIVADASKNVIWNARFEGDLSGRLWLVYETVDAQQGASTQQDKLLEAIVFSLGLSAKDLCLVALTPTDDPQSGPLFDQLQNAMLANQPTVILLMGLGAAQSLLSCEKSMPQLQQEQHRLSGGQTALQVSHSLDQLLQDPDKKAELWLDLQRTMQQFEL